MQVKWCLMSLTLSACVADYRQPAPVVHSNGAHGDQVTSQKCENRQAVSLVKTDVGAYTRLAIGDGRSYLLQHPNQSLSLNLKVCVDNGRFRVEELSWKDPALLDGQLIHWRQGDEGKVVVGFQGVRQSTARLIALEFLPETGLGVRLWRHELEGRQLFLSSRMSKSETHGWIPSTAILLVGDLEAQSVRAPKLSQADSNIQAN